MNKHHNIVYVVSVLVILLALFSCSTTKNIPENDKLFTGLKKIEYKNYEKNEHFTETQEEMESVLATAPNGALFGSSYYRTWFPYSLWIWNAFSNSNSKFGKWITKAFGKQPVLMSWVNPELRATVAQSTLRKHGYFHGKVDYNIVKQKNPKQEKVGYVVDMGHLFRIDTIRYVNFPTVADSMIKSNLEDAKIKKGDPFDVAMLDAERKRIAGLFRNNGYFYYDDGYASYLADTVSVPGKVSLKLQLADSLEDKVTHKWYIGNIDIMLKKDFMEQLGTSFTRRNITLHYNGRRPPLRTRVILRDLKLRHGEPFSYEKQFESSNKISTSGIFNYVDFRFTPRDSSASCDTLDLELNCVFDKPYDIYVEANGRGKTNGRIGPELVLGFSKRNAFRGGEKLTLNLYGSYEWQTGHAAEGSSSKVNSYEYGGDISLELPRLLLPVLRNKRFYTTPTTTMKVSSNVLNRADYFKRRVVSGELTYKFQKTATSQHTFSPLTIQYEYMKNYTDKFKQLIDNNPFLYVSMADQFITKMSYTYNYISPSNYRNPIMWTTFVSEAGNILSLGYMATGKKWNTKEKELFKNPYAQYFKIETDFVKVWRIGEHSTLVGHINTGVIYSYGNSTTAPYSEQFYVGGANSIRAFTVRSIGPGAYFPKDSRLSYIEQTGDFKLLGNLEFRPRLFGDLYGALFLDAGNVWTLHNDTYRTNAKFRVKNILKEMALGTGVGIRYDMGMFVIRVDWGLGLHLPYKSGFYNIPSFKDGQSIHLAIGYPF